MDISGHIPVRGVMAKYTRGASCIHPAEAGAKLCPKQAILTTRRDWSVVGHAIAVVPRATALVSPAVGPSCLEQGTRTSTSGTTYLEVLTYYLWYLVIGASTRGTTDHRHVGPARERWPESSRAGERKAK